MLRILISGVIAVTIGLVGGWTFPAVKESPPVIASASTFRAEPSPAQPIIATADAPAPSEPAHHARRRKLSKSGPEVVTRDKPRLQIARCEADDDDDEC